MKDKKNPLSFQLDVSDFLPADEKEKQGLVIMRESKSFWRDGMKRFSKNIIGMISLIVIIIIMIIAFIVPSFYPYSYEYQDRESLDVPPMSFSDEEKIRMVQGRETRLAFAIPAGLDIVKADILLEFDSGELNLSSLLQGPIINEGSACNESFATNGKMQTAQFTYNSTEPINDEGNLFYLKFRSLPNATFQKSPVKVTKCEMTNSKGEKVNVSTVDGYVNILERLDNSPVENIITTPVSPNTVVLTGSEVQKTENVFIHLFGTDGLGRDYAIRIMMGARISLIVGLIASFIILIIGSLFGSIAGYLGGKVDMVMMRIVDIIYTVPDILIIILLTVTLKYPLQSLADSSPMFAWINTVGVGLISIFIVFSLLYWVGMARMVRSQILTLKEQEYITAARALGANNTRIIKKHLLTNCIGTLIVTTTLQIPASIFTESYLSFLGLGVAAPMPSLGSLASDAIGGLQSFPHRLLAPAIMIVLIILSFNLLGDGLRDAFDPKLKK